MVHEVKMKSKHSVYFQNFNSSKFIYCRKIIHCDFFLIYCSKKKRSKA